VADSPELFVAETRQCSTLAPFQLLDLERIVSLVRSKHFFNNLSGGTCGVDSGLKLRGRHRARHIRRSIAMGASSLVVSGARPLLAVFGAVILCCSLSTPSLDAQGAADVRDVLLDRVGDLSALQVPDDVADFPQPRLEDGSLDPRFGITDEKVRLGRFLFFDPIRSNHILPEFGGDPATAHTASCGSCHMGEAASKAGQVNAMGVGGLGRHVMEADGSMTALRVTDEDLVDTVPTAMEILDEAGNVTQSGRFDAIDTPPRVAPSVIGFAFNNRLLWGGEAGEENDEEYPAQEDIVRLASGAHRMANPDTSELQGIPVYVELFRRAFPTEAANADTSGDLGDLVSIDTQFRAIAAFCRTVMTHDTPWDRFIAGDDDALTARQLRGAFLFSASTEDGGANCIACHSGPALNKRLGDEEGLLVEENFDNLGVAEHPVFDLAREVTGNEALRDNGRFGVTGLSIDRFEFKSPTLRQMRDAAPFFHGGDFGTIREVVEYFNAGVPRNEEAAGAGNVSELFTNPRGGETVGLGLGADDVDALVDFLENGLYDKGFVEKEEGARTRVFELMTADLTYEQDLLDLGAQDGWLPSGLPNGFNDEVSRDQIVFVRGSITPGDEDIDISDAQRIFGYLFLDGPRPAPMVASDVNDDGKTDMADGIFLLSWLFRGGDAPFAPFPEEGQDLTKN